MISHHRFAFVIPTKDRPQDLRRLLRSIQSQSVKPDQCIIVDGGEVTVENVVHDFMDLRIEYVRVYPPALSAQRNAGMQRLHPSITLAGYLDDDLLLEAGALDNMAAFWETASPEVGGAAFNIINNTGAPRFLFLKSLFFLESRKRGRVLRSGYETSLWPAKETSHVQWLCGGATIWRREIVERFSYDEWFVGSGYLEDVDFSYRVGKRYRLVVVGNAPVTHVSSPLRRDRFFLLGKWRVINRFYFVKKHTELSVMLCTWAFLGQILLNVVSALTKLDRCMFDQARGNISGLRSLIAGRAERVDGHYR